MTYGGGVSCAGSIGLRTLDVVPQVEKVAGGSSHWYSIALHALYQGPAAVNPLRLKSSASAISGHRYRLLVVARVTLSSGQSAIATACAACSGHPTLSLNGRDSFLGAPSNSDVVRGSGCTMTQDGLVFTLVNGAYVLSYGGFLFCPPAGASEAQHLTVCFQVRGHSGGWYTVGGSCVSGGSSSGGPVVLDTARTTLLGHSYRIKTVAVVRHPSNSGTVTTTKTLYSAGAAP